MVRNLLAHVTYNAVIFFTFHINRFLKTLLPNILRLRIINVLMPDLNRRSQDSCVHMVPSACLYTLINMWGEGGDLEQPAGSLSQGCACAPAVIQCGTVPFSGPLGHVFYCFWHPQQSNEAVKKRTAN